ncbi:MAG: hypothetical protein ACRDY7_01275 [Acidimicrobiia bacterium]
MDFYDEVMRELLVALGAALFVGNLVALTRRRRPPARVAAQSEGPLEPVPLARTVTYIVVGFVVMLWGIASIAVS